MAERERIKTTKKEIVDYWAGHVDESDLSIDFAEAHERCWRCGCKRRLDRCHIIPDSLGGEDEPSNFVLLCSRCHLDNPNVMDKEIMWDWLRAYSTSLYDTFWYLLGMREYEKIYAVPVQEEYKKRNITGEALLEFQEILKRQYAKASYHFGDPHLNVATLAGIYRMSFKEYDTLHGLKTEKQIGRYVNLGEFL